MLLRGSCAPGESINDQSTDQQVVETPFSYMFETTDTRFCSTVGDMFVQFRTIAMNSLVLLVQYSSYERVCYSWALYTLVKLYRLLLVLSSH